MHSISSHVDQILINGSLYGANGPALGLTALVVRNGRIAYVGDDATARSYASSGMRVIDLGGRTVMPSFVDAHAHPIDGFLMTGDCDLGGADSLDTVTARLRDAAAKTSGEDWLLAGNADLLNLGDAPSSATLDAIVADRPMLLIGQDVHSGLLNTAGLRTAGITAGTADPEGGRYQRAPSGQPTGLVHEAALYNLFRLLPQLAPDKVPAALAKAQALAHSVGVTGWFDALVGERLLRGYSLSHASGGLDAMVSLGLLASPHMPIEPQIERFAQWRAAYDDDRLHLHTVKIFVDGVLESHTAALLEPYADVGGLGMRHWEPEQLCAAAELADRAGFDLHFHTLGDRAVRMALDAIEHVRHVRGPRDRRPQLAHVQLIHPDDVTRFRPLGAIANIQAAWGAAPDGLLALYRDLLGETRMSRHYVFRSLRNAGALLSAGSDWPVSTMNPLVAIQTAMTRCLPDRPHATAWLPEQCLDLQAMLEAYTCNAAWSLRFDQRMGRLVSGMDASLAILDRNLFALPPDAIAEARVQATVFQGRTVYGAIE